MTATKEKIEDLFNGSIGFFYPLDENLKFLEGDPHRGYIQLDNSGNLLVDTLDENPIGSLIRSQGVRTPPALWVTTKENSAILLDVSRSGSSFNIGGSRASVNQFTCRVAVFDTSPRNTSSLQTKKLELYIPEATQWAGLRFFEDDIQRFPGSNVIESYTLRRKGGASEEYTSIADNSGLSVTLGADLSINKSGDLRQVYAPVRFGVSSVDPVSFWTLLGPLMRIQDLMSLAFDRPVVSTGGRAHMDGEEGSSRRSFWTSWLMTKGRDGNQNNRKSRQEFFTLADLGGLPGLAKWVDLCNVRQRAVEPLINRYRYGRFSPEQQLLELASGIEYWRAAHARDPEATWAKEKYQPKAVALQAGEAFANWVGDPDKWAKEFWNAYNGLKHDASYKPDTYEIELLCTAARRLLSSVLLMSCANSEAIVANFYSSVDVMNEGPQIQEMLARK